MKKIFYVLAFLFSFGIYAQSPAPQVEAIRFIAVSEIEMNAFTRAEQGTVCYRSDTNSLFRYNGSTWDEIGSSGGGHTIKDKGVNLAQRDTLDFVGGGVTVTDDSGNGKTIVTIPANPTDSQISTAFLNINPDTDLDSTNDVTLSGTQTITGIKNFTNDIEFQNSTVIRAENDAVNNNLTLKGASDLTKIYVDYNGNGSGFSNLSMTSTNILYNGTSLLGNGNVTGPASSTDNAIARFDSTTGKIIQNSGVTIDDSNNMSGLTTLSSTGITGTNNVVGGYLQSNTYINMVPTDTEPASFEGRSYADNSENRPKYYDGTSWKAFLLDGDVVGDGTGTDDQTAAEVPIADTGDNFTATDVEGALAELAGASGTDSGQTKTYGTGSSETLTLSSFLEGGSLTGRAKVVAHTANDTITTATGLGQTGRYISALHLLNGADSVYIKKGSGATLINRTIAYNGSGVSEDGIWATTDFFLSITSDGAIEVDGSDVFLAHTEVVENDIYGNFAGAAAFPNATANAGWTGFNGATYSLETSDTRTGTSAIRVDGTTGSASSAEVYLQAPFDEAITNGDVITWRGYVKNVSGSTAGVEVKFYDDGAYREAFNVDESNTTTFQYFELTRTVLNAADFFLILDARDTSIIIVDDIELIKNP